MAETLARYKAKRNFANTPEPDADAADTSGAPAPAGRLSYVVQKHWASHLHYDFRLELDGSMKSWAVPKGPSLDPHDKRLAVQVEDHPIAYNQFEGVIPPGQYGAGKVVIWDEGSWAPVGGVREAAQGYASGNLKFELHGHKLQGRWALVRLKGKTDTFDKPDKQPPWLLIKEKDGFARPAAEFSLVDEMPDSVVPLRTSKAAKPATATKTASATKTTKTTKAAKATKATKPAKANAAADSPPPGKAAALPRTLQPQLATLVEAVPGDPADWLFEVKFDGYRLLARVDGDAVQLLTRNGHDWTAKLPHLAQAVAALGLQSAWLDGEIVVFNEQGVPDFQRLQNAFEVGRTGSIVYCLFDMPYLNGRDLRHEPLATRRALLQQLLGKKPPASLRFSEEFDAPPDQLRQAACHLGLEGVIGKKKDAPYVSQRSGNWIKLKCTQRQEFVIVGYTDPQGSRTGLGALLLAVHDAQGALQYAGNVGTGFNTATLKRLRGQLGGIASATSPLASAAGLNLKQPVHWVKPELLAEVSFAEWTATGRVRHAVFHGLRADKPARAIVRERPTPVAEAAATATATATTAEKTTTAAVTATGLKVTHPDRVVDPASGTTKLDLVRFYSLVSPLLLAHLKGRPVSLVRAPDGIGGELFFQKHLEGSMPGVTLLDPALDPGHAPLMEVATATAVLSAAQLNVVEFHTWNGVKTALDHPDRMTFDLDPGDGVAWATVQHAAEVVRLFLSQLGLASFVKTSGGKGLHVVVAVKRLYSWPAVKSFSQAIAEHLAQTLPKLFVAKSGPKNRVGKIFIDYLRNGFGATTVAAWSARARPGMGVSVPLAWNELAKASGSAHWTVANIHTRLDQGNAPWAAYAPQSLGGAMKLLGFSPPK